MCSLNSVERVTRAQYQRTCVFPATQAGRLAGYLLSGKRNFAVIWANFSHDDGCNQPAASMKATEGGKISTFIMDYASKREWLTR